MENEEKNAAQESAETTEQPLFENIAAPGYEEYLQCYKKLRFYSPQARVYWIAVALYIVLMAVLMIAWHIFSPLALSFLAVILGLFVCRLVYIPRKQAKANVSRLQESYGGIPEIALSFYGDRIVIQKRGDADSGEASLPLRYEAFAYCGETQDVLALVTRQKQLLPVVKSGFIGTDAEGFKQFMREKAPNAKFCW